MKRWIAALLCTVFLFGVALHVGAFQATSAAPMVADGPNPPPNNNSITPIPVTEQPVVTEPSNPMPSPDITA